MAATTNWSDIVPNFESMPDAMQQWLVTNLPTFIGQAVQQGLQQGFDQHWGVAATGNSYHLVGTDHTHAVMGDHNEVVGGQTTRTRLDSVTTHNFANELKVTDGNQEHQIGGDARYSVDGALSHTVQGYSNTKVGGDHVVTADGNGVAAAMTHTVISGLGATGGDSVITHSHVVAGSKHEQTSGTHLTQSAKMELSVGQPLTWLTAAAASPPAQQSSVATAQTPEQAEAIDVLEKADADEKAKLSSYAPIPSLGGGGAWAEIGSVLGKIDSPDSTTVAQFNFGGDVKTVNDGNEYITTTGKRTDTVLKGLDEFIKGPKSATHMGVGSETTIGLSMDTVLGLAMPFTTLSMGFVLLNMDADLFVVESKSFQINLTDLSITTPGGKTYGGGGAAKAADVAKAAKEAKAAVDASEEAAKSLELVKAVADATEDLKAGIKSVADVTKNLADAAVKVGETASNAAEVAEGASKAAAAAGKAAGEAGEAAAQAGEAAAQAGEAAAQGGKAATSAAKAVELSAVGKVWGKTVEEARAVTSAVKDATKSGEAAAAAGESAKVVGEAAKEAGEAAAAAGESAKGAGEVAAAAGDAAVNSAKDTIATLKGVVTQAEAAGSKTEAATKALDVLKSLVTKAEQAQSAADLTKGGKEAALATAEAAEISRAAKISGPILSTLMKGLDLAQLAKLFGYGDKVVAGFLLVDGLKLIQGLAKAGLKIASTKIVADNRANAGAARLAAEQAANPTQVGRVSEIKNDGLMSEVKKDKPET